MTEYEEARLVKEFPELEHFTDMIEEWHKEIHQIIGPITLSESVAILKAAGKILGL